VFRKLHALGVRSQEPGARRQKTESLFDAHCYGLHPLARPSTTASQRSVFHRPHARQHKDRLICVEDPSRQGHSIVARYEVPGNGTEDTSVPAGTIETLGARFRIRCRERELVIRSSTQGRIGF
jgi:hypothetical protein